MSFGGEAPKKNPWVVEQFNIIRRAIERLHEDIEDTANCPFDYTLLDHIETELDRLKKWLHY